MRAEGRRDFGRVDGIIGETARTVDAFRIAGDPHFRGISGLRFLE